MRPPAIGAPADAVAVDVLDAVQPQAAVGAVRQPGVVPAGAWVHGAVPHGGVGWVAQGTHVGAPGPRRDAERVHGATRHPTTGANGPRWPCPHDAAVVATAATAGRSRHADVPRRHAAYIRASDAHTSRSGAGVGTYRSSGAGTARACTATCAGTKQVRLVSTCYVSHRRLCTMFSGKLLVWVGKAGVQRCLRCVFLFYFSCFSFLCGFFHHLRLRVPILKVHFCCCLDSFRLLKQCARHIPSL